MSAKPILFVCLLSCFLKWCLSGEPKQIKGKPGENVTLQCQDPSPADIKLLRWRKTDLQSDQGYVYFSRMKDFNEHEQHPSFRGRVKLSDPQMKDGNVSVILKNLTSNDTGTYECYVGKGNEPKLIATIHLTVTDSGDDKRGGDKDGNVGLKVGLSVVALLVGVVGVVGVVMYRKRKGPKEETSYKAADDKDTDHQLV
ncbi:coxsackievirus and adenovirus receptor-like [Channa argus]|uniref:coxsackievirus and adenovirus receptor-like n=1 Tax=Channa argus TaxID=215402 RepID=UPI0035222047